MHITRPLRIPDELRISRYAKNPELGPRILFFSGGSALNSLSRRLKNYTHNSIHLVTPYDSGGSSAVLRKAFDIPAVGDLRSRMMALADETVLGHPDIYRLFHHRFDKGADNADLKQRLKDMVAGDDALTAAISKPMRTLICNHLGYFLQVMPKDFDLQGASIGNLILVGGYINHHRKLDPIIFLFSQLVNVHGTVRSITEDDYHLEVELHNGKTIVGQHLFTGKETAEINRGIRNMRLVESLDGNSPANSKLRKPNRKLIQQAELICFPMGSFYSSVLANLLPEGVGAAVRANACPKVYIPNCGHDPEQKGMTLADQIDTLLHYLKRDAGSDCIDCDLLNFIVLDSRAEGMADAIPHERLRKAGIQLIDTPLLKAEDPTRYDSDLLLKTLLSLT